MNRREAIESLSSESATTRLRGARALLELAQPVDLDQIRDARAREFDSWTQRGLDRVISRLNAGGRLNGIPTEDTVATPAIGAADAYAEALQAATKRVLHEVRPVVQSIERAARLDINSFEGSSTQSALRRLATLLDALQSLGEAAESPKLVEFDLTELIGSQLQHEGIRVGGLLLARSDPMLVRGDPALLTLALLNLVRNAVEASVGRPSAVVLNWGRGTEEAWISVLDEGDGLPPDALSAAFEVGTTTRSEGGHFGLGLPIAAQAMSSLGGSVTLRPRSDLGTAAELRWRQ